MFQKLLSPFKRLPLGWYRIWLVTQFLVPFILTEIITEMVENDYYYDFYSGLGILLTNFIGYFIFCRLIVFIYEGFKSGK